MAILLTACSALGLETNQRPAVLETPGRVYVLPIREEIMPPLVYLVRRGVKEAMEQGATLLIVDMNTPGGRVDTCREIISILGQFKGDTATYVNRDAFSAGAFIAVATKRIYMAPESVIGAAAPVIMNPGGDGIAQIPETFEKKMNSAIRAMVRATAEKNGYNVAVIEAMIDKDKGLVLSNVVDGVTNVHTIARPGEILTLTNTEAEREYGHPPRPLLSSGTVATLDDLIEKLGYPRSARVDIKPTGAERLAFWINTISPILLMIGVVGLYIEFKTPGFGLPGILGITAFVLYFFGGYVAGFSGPEWIIVFLVGLALVLLELFVFTGTFALGVIGALLMLLSIVMALVDVYPATPPPARDGGWPVLPSLPSLAPGAFDRSLVVLTTAMLGVAVSIFLLRKFLPRTVVYQQMVSTAASGAQTVAAQEKRRSVLVGATGVAISNLRPGGKAQFGDEILDVITEGDLLPKGSKVKILGFSATEAIVRAEQE